MSPNIWTVIKSGFYDIYDMFPDDLALGPIN